MADDSAIIDMDGADTFEPSHGSHESSDGSANPTTTTTGQSTTEADNISQDDNRGFFSSAQQTVSQTVTNMMWETGRAQATKAWSIYGNIDLLRPYFDVEPRDVIKRMINSFIPRLPSSNPTKVVNELYGPTMLVLTLIALLLYEMKSSGHTVKEGTLIGTAFGTCFGYWAGCGTIAWLVAYVCNTHITYLQIISMMGYSLTSHCVVVLLSTVIHTSHDHVFFYALWGVFGGLSTLRMMSILVSRTHGPSQKLVICGVAAFLNLTFLLYLHFAYHQVVEEFDEILHAPHQDVPVNPDQAAKLLELPETQNI